jgi:RimJ/RimL family protein N-acetyltransferase
MANQRVILTTERLILREVQLADWPVVLNYQQQPDYLRYYPWRYRTPQAVQEFLNLFIEWQQEEPRTKFQLAVTLPHTGQLIGLCGIRKRYPQAHEAEVGYEIDPGWWGRGYATEAALAMVNFAFANLGIHRVWASCISENGASVRVLEKTGLLCEGRLRENRWMKGRWWDSLIYAILEPEWWERLELAKHAGEAHS